MPSKKVTRREMLEKCIAGGLLVAAAPMPDSKLLALWTQPQNHLLKPTPGNALGPFFKKGAPETSTLRVPGDQGLRLTVSGAIIDLNGEPIRDAIVEVWQADHSGHYDLTGYRYRARLALLCATDYAMETIMPGHYPDRVAQHIHYIVSAPGRKTLVTQLYFATDRVFEGDPDRHYVKDPLVSSRDLIRPVTLNEIDGAIHAAVNFDLRLESD